MKLIQKSNLKLLLSLLLFHDKLKNNQQKPNNPNYLLKLPQLLILTVRNPDNLIAALKLMTYNY